MLIPALLIASATNLSAATPQTQIPVKLFGQACMLGGPFDQNALKQIDAISPEKIPPVQTSKQLRASLDVLSKAANLPAALDDYRDKLTQRLKAQIRFGEVIAEKSALTELKKHVRSKLAESFEAGFKKIQAKGPIHVEPQLAEAKTLYEESIEAYPEDDFHRAIKKIHVQYNCTFEEEEGGE